jgi:SAM-dependent methyltransferase
MRLEIQAQLLALNRDFYRQMAAPFARSRARPQPGYQWLLTKLPQPSPSLLDVGCGDGRFGRYLLTHQAIIHYTGVDFSPELVATAQTPGGPGFPGLFYQRDLSQPGCLDDLDRFPAIACLATLQHIPGRANRQRLLAEIGQHLEDGGRLFLSNWQFLTHDRQRRKITEWSAIGLSPADVEANDYLLTWQSGGFALRYLSLIDESETAALAQSAGLTILSHFHSDGKEGNLNLYTTLTKP